MDIKLKRSRRYMLREIVEIGVVSLVVGAFVVLAYLYYLA